MDTLNDLSHDEVEAAAAELARVMSAVYPDSAYSQTDVLNLAQDMATGRTAHELGLALAAIAGGAQEDAELFHGMSWDEVRAAAGLTDDSGTLALSVADRATAHVEALRIMEDARERGTLRRAGTRKSGPDLTQDVNEPNSDDLTAGVRPDGGQGSVDYYTEMARRLGIPVGANLESPRGSSQFIRPKSPGHRALERRRAAGSSRLEMASPSPAGSAAAPVGSAYSGTLTL